MASTSASEKQEFDSLEVTAEPIIFEPIQNYFTIIRKIGTGGYGTVFCARDVVTKETKALKLIEYEETCIQVGLINEVCTPAELDHPNILKVEKVIYVIRDNTKYVCLVMPKYDMDLATYAIDKKLFGSSENIILAMYKICLGIAHMTSRGMIHGDLKPENILIKCGKNNQIDTNNIVITDFGFSQYFVCTNDKNTGILYTLPQRPPEIHLEYKYTNKVDIWALGCVFYTLLTGNYPFSPLISEVSEDFVLNNIFKKRGNPLSLAPQLTSTNRWEPFVKGTNVNLWKKVDMFRSNKLINSTLDAMLDINPTTRLNIHQVLDLPIFSPFRHERIREKISCENVTLELFKPPSSRCYFTSSKLIERNKVLKWLFEVSIEEVVSSANIIYYIDLFDKIFSVTSVTSVSDMSPENNWKLGICTYIISSNLLNQYSSIGIMSEYTNNKLTPEEITEYTFRVLRDTDYKVNFTTVYNYAKIILRQHAGASTYEESVKTMGIFCAMGQLYQIFRDPSIDLTIEERVKSIFIMTSIMIGDDKIRRIKRIVSKAKYVKMRDLVLSRLNKSRSEKDPYHVFHGLISEYFQRNLNYDISMFINKIKENI